MDDKTEFLELKADMKDIMKTLNLILQDMAQIKVFERDINRNRDNIMLLFDRNEKLRNELREEVREIKKEIISMVEEGDKKLDSISGRIISLEERQSKDEGHHEAKKDLRDGYQGWINILIAGGTALVSFLVVYLTSMVGGA